MNAESNSCGRVSPLHHLSCHIPLDTIMTVTFSATPADTPEFTLANFTQNTQLQISQAESVQSDSSALTEPVAWGYLNGRKKIGLIMAKY